MNPSIRKKSYSLAPFLMAAGLAWAVSGELSAQVPGTWTNPAGGAWTTSGNWLSGIVAGMTSSPGSGDAGTATFNQLDLTSDIALTTSGTRYIGHLVFGDLVPSNHSWSLSGDALTLNEITPTISVQGSLGTGSTTISSVLAGTTGMNKQGLGTLILTGNNTYTGGTFVRGGQLVLDYANGGRLPTTAPLQFGTAAGYGNSNAGGGIFTLKGGTGGDVVHQMGSLTFSAGQSRLWVDSGTSGVDTLQFQNVVRGPSGSLHVDLRSSSGGVVGGVRISETSSGIINAALGAGVVDSTGVVINTGVVGTGGLSVTDFGGTGFLAATSLGGGNYSIQRYTNYTSTTISGTTTGFFNTANANYKIAAQASPLTLTTNGVYASLLIDTSASAGSLNLNSGVTLTNSGGNFSGIILSGAHNYEISGAGSLVSTDTNTPFQLSAFGGGTLTVSAQLNVYRMAISGDGVVVLSNTSNVVSADPAAAVSYGIFDGGTLSISAASNLGSAGRTIYFDSGTLRTTQSGPLTLSGNMGTMRNLATFDVTQATGELSLTGIISQNGHLAKTGAGTLLLSGANTYTGSTEVRAGTLSASNIVVSGGNSHLGNSTSVVTLGAATTKGTLSYTGNSATFTRGFTLGAGGGQLDVTTSGQTLTIGTRGITGTSGLFTVGGAGNTTITSAITTGTGGLTKTGVGTLTLSNSGNTYTGLTTVSEGTLAYGVNNVISTGAVTVNGSGTLALGNFSDTVGAVTLTSGSITGTGGALTGTSFAVESGSVSAVLAGSGAVTKSTVGSVTFSAANTYTGTTLVSGGTLILSGSGSIAGSTTVNVASGATLNTTAVGPYTYGATQTLMGNGTIIGNTIIQGTLAAGNSPGILTFNDNVTLDGSNSIFEIQNTGMTRGTDYDGVNVEGILTYDGTLTLTLTTLIGNGTYDLFDFETGDFTGSFASVVFSGSPYTGAFTYDGSNFYNATSNGQIFSFGLDSGDLIVSAIPEPSTTLLLAGALTALVIFRRRRQ